MKIDERVRNLRQVSSFTEEKIVDREKDRVVIDHG
jgi:hypothetical protein